MSNLKLQQDELELLVSYEAEEWKSAKKIKEQKEQYRAYARATLRKDKRINIRISQKDLLDLQKRAVRQGIPYQTLISSVLHKYVSGGFTEK
jgi:predicted DNA binding CopG/RHH family protein